VEFGNLGISGQQKTMVRKHIYCEASTAENRPVKDRTTRQLATDWLSAVRCSRGSSSLGGATVCQ